MSTTLLIETLKSKAAEDRQAYDDLIERLLNEEAIDSEESIGILNRVGKSPDDLSADMARTKRIAELHAIIDEGPALSDERTKFTTAYAERAATLKAEWETAKKRLDECDRDFRSKSMEFQVRGDAINAARRELAQM